MSVWYNVCFWLKSQGQRLFCNLVFRISSVQSLSCVRVFVIPWTAACQASPSITQLLELAQTNVHQGSDAIQPSHPLLSPFLPAFNLAHYQGFSSESVLHIKWPKFRSFSFSISASNQYSELISFRIDWFDPLAVQGTLKSLLQHYSSKASILQCSAFFMVQLSHPYIATEKTIILTGQTLVGKVMSLLFKCYLGWS